MYDFNYQLSKDQRQENELLAIMKKRNSAGWKLILISTTKVDTKTQFSNLYLFLGKELVINFDIKIDQFKSK